MELTSATGGAEKAAPKRRRARSADEARRTNRVRFWYSDEEVLAVRRAADEAGLSVAAFSAAATLAAAHNAEHEAVEGGDQRGALVELLRARTGLRRIGNNLNQIARELNSDQVVTAAQAEAVLARVEAAVRRVDEATLQVMRERKPRP
ncbi:MobC family plasmid mobilization relaxosome protein [Streptomyces koyangensis]|uniref:MobC family plasmid mobilization relaxosome protein n=1 Tax=Streptomyces koyangensis TaxID=188770 RepID=UPI003C2E4749